MICDIGGGTTEVAVLSLGDIVAQQSVRVAGDAMDRAIVDYLRRHYNLRVGASAAERLRIEIGSAYPLEDELSDEVRGVDMISGLPRKATITSEEVREALKNLCGSRLTPSANAAGAEGVGTGGAAAGGGATPSGQWVDIPPYQIDVLVRGSESLAKTKDGQAARVVL